MATRRYGWLFLAPVLALPALLEGCGGASPASSGSAPPAATVTLGNYALTGDTSPVRDPSIMREGSTYYAFTSDPAQPDPSGYLPVRCSGDQTSWAICGYVFTKLPAWAIQAVPGADNLWAPDISYFNNIYHLYYAVSTLFSQVSVIGLATNTTLDPASPQSKWVDQGPVLSSTTGDDFNAIDPNILVDEDGSVLLNYGSFWTGIKQKSLDPTTGKLSGTESTTWSLARRPALDHAVEGASLVRHGSYYYLFISTGHCCEATYLADDYEEAFGRSASPHGPFFDENGIDLAAGGGTVLLQQTADWNAPGGATAYIDPSTGENLIVFHALKMGPDPTGYLWLKHLAWENDWPGLQ